MFLTFLKKNFIEFKIEDSNSYYQIKIDGYFRNEAITLRIPNTEESYKCCEDAKIGHNLSTVSFENDMTNDKVEINIG